MRWVSRLFRSMDLGTHLRGLGATRRVKVSPALDGRERGAQLVRGVGSEAAEPRL
jgi:hypothetical protein